MTLQRGDTLIEVLFAVTIFSMIMVGAITLMNQGSAAAQRSLEISLVRQQIDGQAETLRYLHDAYVAAYTPGAAISASSPAGRWVTLRDNYVNTTAASDFTLTSNTCPTPPIGKRFILNPAKTSVSNADSFFKPATSFAQIERNAGGSLTAARGLWVEGVESARVNGVGYIDFHIRACWPSPGSSVPMTIATIVRLYDKR